MTRVQWVASLAAGLGALVVMVLPTWRMNWGPEGDFYTYEPWFSLLALGYGNFLLIPSLVACIAGVLIVLASRRSVTAPRAAAIAFGISTALALGAHLIVGTYGLVGFGWLAPILTAAAAAVVAFAILHKKRATPPATLAR